MPVLFHDSIIIDHLDQADTCLSLLRIKRAFPMRRDSAFGRNLSFLCYKSSDVLNWGSLHGIKSEKKHFFNLFGFVGIGWLYELRIGQEVNLV